MTISEPISERPTPSARTSWYKALSMAERLGRARIPGRSFTQDERDRGARRLSRWRSQAPFQNEALFTERLRADGIGPEDLIELLGEPPESLAASADENDAWLRTLDVVYEKACCLEQTDEPLSLLTAFEPLLNAGRERVREGALALAGSQIEVPFDPNTVVNLFEPMLSARVTKAVLRTLVLELNVARLEERLAGDTPPERFADFLAQLRDPKRAIELLADYPVLARRVVVLVDHWAEFSLSFLMHLTTDQNDIRQIFGDPGLLTGLEGDAGDCHQGGGSVSIAQFSSGLRLVYKPKPMAIDLHFQQLLEWLNDRGAVPGFRVLELIARDTHGWVEFVEKRPCDDQSGLEHYYQRLGGLLAILYLLEAVDFHFENVKASGEHPVPVDLEALFHPRFREVDEAGSPGAGPMAASVLRVGLLPVSFSASAGEQRLDLSGMGGSEEQLTPFEAPVCENAGTDEMQITRRRIPIQGSENRPVLDGVEAAAIDYTDAIVTGFEQTYRLLMEHRSELLAESGPIGRFRDDVVRAIIRSTRVYGLLLDDSYHPDCLGDAMECDRVFDRLWLGIKDLPVLAAAFPFEREDLWDGDIPLFHSRPGSTDLWSSRGVRIANFFREPAWNVVQRRIVDLSEEDLSRQQWYIRAALATLATGTTFVRHMRERATPALERASPERLLNAACDVGDRLQALAHVREGCAGWIGLSLLDESRCQLFPLGPELYDGISGIALFLAWLGDLTGKGRYSELAQQALRAARLQMNHPEITGRPTIGGFSGWGGWIYALSHIGHLWGDRELLSEAEEWAARVRPAVRHDKGLDVLSGAAGCIGGLLALYRLNCSSAARQAALECGDFLLEQAQPMPRGIAWSSSGMDYPLAGFAHGAAGFSWALLELFGISGAARYRNAAVEAMEFERALFSPKHGNWPDLRNLDIPLEQRYLTSWCHGAAGIGLARLRALRYVDETPVRAEIDAALRTTLVDGFDFNHSLCHGDLGNIELLHEAARTLDPWWAMRVEVRSAQILDRIRNQGWLCGNPLKVESPGLMTGLAGIGYGLLRLAAPDRVPSVLLLDPPLAAGDPMRGA